MKNKKIENFSIAGDRKMKDEFIPELRSKEDVLKDLSEMKEDFLQTSKYFSDKTLVGINGKPKSVMVSKKHFDDGSDCPLFWKLFDNLSLFQKHEEIEIDTGIMTSTVQNHPYKFKTSLHPQITLWLGNNHIRLSPHNDEIEITRVWINPEIHGKGLGSFFMDLVINTLWYLNDFYPPKLILETTGAVGSGKNEQITPIKKQCEFFRKFGFRVFDVEGGMCRRMRYVDYTRGKKFINQIIRDGKKMELKNVA